MYIKKLYIKDFGIYNNCTLENISPKIVVLGGKNRAGKSTLLELLRSLPYGFNKSMNIKCTRGQYEAYGQFINKKDEIVNLSLKGYSKPHIFNSNGKEEFFDLYEDVDKYTYSQIFTISLDELEGKSDEDKKLRAVLLGAGFKELLVLPEMISDFRKEAEKIAGKNGNPASRLLKPFYNEIKEGNSIKKSAVSQIEYYKDKEEKLKNLNEQIETLKNYIKTNENSVYVLQFIKSNYDNYKRMQQLDNIINAPSNNSIHNEETYKKVSLEFLENLKSEYENLDKKYEMLRNEFYDKYNISKDEVDNFKKYAGEIDKWQLLASGISEKVDNYNKELKECQNLKDIIEVDITDVNSENKDGFSWVLDIKTDEISFFKISEDIDKLKQFDYEIKEKNHKLNELIEGSKRLNYKDNPKAVFIKYSAFYIVLFTIAFAVYNINKIFGALIIVLGVLILALNVLIKKNNNYVKEIEDQKEAINKICINRDALNDTVNEYKHMLKLNDDVSNDSIKNYFMSIRNLKKKIIDLKHKVDYLSDFGKDIELELCDILNILKQFKSVLQMDFNNESKDIILDSKNILAGFSLLLNVYEEYVKYNFAYISKLNIEKKIDKIILAEGQGDIYFKLNEFIDKFKVYIKLKNDKEEYTHIKNNILNSIDSYNINKILMVSYSEANEEDLMQNLKKRINAYESSNKIDEKIRNIYKINNEKKDQLHKFQEEKIKIENEIQNIYTMDDVKKAQSKIEVARREMKLAAHEYACNRACEFILSKLQNNIINGAKNTIFDSSSRVFNTITAGEYTSILPSKDLSISDFASLKNDGSKDENLGVLSRGTKEELFLSIRLSRIMDINTKLPVIIDDSLVNFDYTHLKNSIKVLKQISNTNQVIFLTCHSEMVKAVYEEDKNAQFFKIQNGKFDLSEGIELQKYLMDMY